MKPVKFKGDVLPIVLNILFNKFNFSALSFDSLNSFVSYKGIEIFFFNFLWLFELLLKILLDNLFKPKIG